MDKEIVRKAYAKINLGLDVTGKTENGYHLLCSVMQQIDLYDVIRIRPLWEKKEVIEFTTNSPDIPADQSNLAVRAAKLMLQTYDLPHGVAIELEKYIPVAAGMAGGSTDAAGVMLGIRDLFELDCSDEDLMELGVSLGADIPFCILGGTALAEGIGEQLTVLKSMPDYYLLIAKPPLFVSTKEVYGGLQLSSICHPRMDLVLEGISEGNLKKMLQGMGNVLESVTGKMHSIIGELEDAMKAQGALGAWMSGSGPTVFGIFESPAQAKMAEDILAKQYEGTFVKAVGIRSC